MKHIDAWWFLSGKTLPHGDGRQIRIGRTHKTKGDIVLCKNGLHASVKPLDALSYCSGPYVWRVRLSGIIVKGDDKLVASERTYLAGGNATETLRHFARLCALDVIHLWDAPPVVRQYLKTGRADSRAAAGAAAGAAAWAAAGAAAGAKQNVRLHRMLNKAIGEK